MTSSCNNKITILDEKENTEENLGDDDPYDNSDSRQRKTKNPDDKLILRKFNGAQLGDMVVCMAISKHLSLIATGNQYGLVVIWGMEYGKIDKVFYAAKGKISFMEFVGEYPLLVVGSYDGVMTVWGTKEGDEAWKH